MSSGNTNHARGTGAAKLTRPPTPPSPAAWAPCNRMPKNAKPPTKKRKVKVVQPIKTTIALPEDAALSETDRRELMMSFLTTTHETTSRGIVKPQRPIKIVFKEQPKVPKSVDAECEGEEDADLTTEDMLAAEAAWSGEVMLPKSMWNVAQRSYNRDMTQLEALQCARLGLKPTQYLTYLDQALHMTSFYLSFTSADSERSPLDKFERRKADCTQQLQAFPNRLRSPFRRAACGGAWRVHFVIEQMYYYHINIRDWFWESPLDLLPKESQEYARYSSLNKAPIGLKTVWKRLSQSLPPNRTPQEVIYSNFVDVSADVMHIFVDTMIVMPRARSAASVYYKAALKYAQVFLYRFSVLQHEEWEVSYTERGADNDLFDIKGTIKARHRLPKMQRINIFLTELITNPFCHFFYKTSTQQTLGLSTSIEQLVEKVDRHGYSYADPWPEFKADLRRVFTDAIERLTPTFSLSKTHFKHVCDPCKMVDFAQVCLAVYVDGWPGGLHGAPPLPSRIDMLSRLDDLGVHPHVRSTAEGRATTSEWCPDAVSLLMTEQEALAKAMLVDLLHPTAKEEFGKWCVNHAKQHNIVVHRRTTFPESIHVTMESLTWQALEQAVYELGLLLPRRLNTRTWLVPSSALKAFSATQWTAFNICPDNSRRLGKLAQKWKGLRDTFMTSSPKLLKLKARMDKHVDNLAAQMATLRYSAIPPTEDTPDNSTIVAMPQHTR